MNKEQSLIGSIYPINTKPYTQTSFKSYVKIAYFFLVPWCCLPRVVEFIAMVYSHALQNRKYQNVRPSPIG